MPGFRTIYRAVVMIAAGVIVVKGWQLYGPTNEQMRVLGERTREIAQSAWEDWQKGSDASTSPSDPRTMPPAAKPHSPPSVELAPLNMPPTPEGIVSAPPLASEVVSEPVGQPAGGPPAATDDRMPALMARLEELGASDAQLALWGTSGELYRFCCRAALADTPAFTRHFEAVAPEPLAAVEQVVAKVEAWRTAQREQTALR